MARHGVLALLAATVLSIGVNGGPCKPHSRSSGSLSSSTILETTTTYTTTSSSVATPEITSSTLSSSDSTPVIPPVQSPSVTPITTPEFTPEPTPIETPSPPACVQSQILVNPGFDDNNNGSPWTLGSGVTISTVNPRSAPNFLYNTFSRGSPSIVNFSQDLPALGTFAYQLTYYINLQTAINGRSFSCTATPMINGQPLAPSPVLTQNGPYGFRMSSQIFTAPDPDEPVSFYISVSCQGDFATVIIGADDVSLTRICPV